MTISICTHAGTLEDIMKWSDVCTDLYACLDLKLNDQKTLYKQSRKTKENKYTAGYLKNEKNKKQCQQYYVNYSSIKREKRRKINKVKKKVVLG